MGKGARTRANRPEGEIKRKREKVPTRWVREVRDHLREVRNREADEFVADMRKARQEVPGATQEIPVVASHPDLEEFSRDELRKQAAFLDIKGRGNMSKQQLIDAIREREAS